MKIDDLRRLLRSGSAQPPLPKPKARRSTRLPAPPNHPNARCEVEPEPSKLRGKSADMLIIDDPIGTSFTTPPTGSPSGAHVVGDLFTTPDGKMMVCLEGGSPGKWKTVGAGAEETHDHMIDAIAYAFSSSVSAKKK